MRSLKKKNQRKKITNCTQNILKINILTIVIGKKYRINNIETKAKKMQKIERKLKLF